MSIINLSHSFYSFQNSHIVGIMGLLIKGTNFNSLSTIIINHVSWKIYQFEDYIHYTLSLSLLLLFLFYFMLN